MSILGNRVLRTEDPKFLTSGGTYVYARHRLGEYWGFLAGWSFVVGKAASLSAMALTFGAYVAPDLARPAGIAAVLALTVVAHDDPSPAGTAFRDELDQDAARLGVELSAQVEVDGVPPPPPPLPWEGVDARPSTVTALPIRVPCGKAATACSTTCWGAASRWV